MATIAQNLQALSDARDDIAASIENKGIILPEGAGFRNFASAIDSIEVPSFPKFGITGYPQVTYPSYPSVKDYAVTLPANITFENNVTELNVDTLNVSGLKQSSLYNCFIGGGNILGATNGSYFYRINKNDVIIYNTPSKINGKTITRRFKLLEYSGDIYLNSTATLKAQVSLNIKAYAYYPSGATYSLIGSSEGSNYLTSNWYSLSGGRLNMENLSFPQTEITVTDGPYNISTSYATYSLSIVPQIRFVDDYGSSYNFYINSGSLYEPIYLKYQVDILNIS